jgi:long-chain acyl-CoA synthetase
MNVDLALYREEVAVSRDPLVRLSYIDVAPENPEQTIVLVHGYGGRALHWNYQLTTFSDDYRVVAVDLRGHGSSDKPNTQYLMDEFVADLEAALPKIGVNDPFVLVGHSFGGAIAAEYAAKHPDLVSRLVLIATAGEYKLSPFLKLVFRLPIVLLNLLEPILRRATLYAPPRVLKEFYLNTLSPWVGWELFEQLQMPALIIRGDRDRVFPDSAFEEVARRIPDSEEVNVGVSSHMVMWERRDAVERAIARFIGTRHTSWRDQGGSSQRRAQMFIQRPWLRHYEEGVPPTLALPNRALPRLLHRAAQRFPNRPATIFMGRTLTYRQLNRQANRLANALRSQGLDTDGRVMLLLPNTPQFVIGYYGILKAGGVVVSASPASKSDEIVRQVIDSKAETLITLTLFSKTTRQALEQSETLKHVVFTNIKDYLAWPKRVLFTLARERKEGHALTNGLQQGEHRWIDLMRGHHATELEVETDPEATALIQYTGGTTDKPKGVMLSHHALMSNSFQTRHWVPGLNEGREALLCVVPFAHIYGMTAAMNVAISIGAAMIILPNFVTQEVLKAIKRYKPTLFPGVPTMYVNINEFPGVRRFGIKSIKACISGAAPLPVEVAEAFEKLTRGRLVEGYGLTEAGPVTHANPLYGRRKFGSIGIPVPNTEAKVMDVVVGKEVSSGQIGELWVRGPQIMQGYWGMGEETDAALHDGWLATGDIVRMDGDGYFQVLSRRKDMILAGTYQVYPRDVEEILYEHPAVKEVAVVGLQKKRWPSKRVKAYVVLNGRHDPEEKRQELMDLCRRRLEEYAVPWQIEFRDELPKSFVGKVLRRLLVEEEGEPEKEML